MNLTKTLTESFEELLKNPDIDMQVSNDKHIHFDNLKQQNDEKHILSDNLTTLNLLKLDLQNFGVERPDIATLDHLKQFWLFIFS